MQSLQLVLSWRLLLNRRSLGLLGESGRITFPSDETNQLS